MRAKTSARDDGGEFSRPPVANPDPGDPTGPPFERWRDVVSGRAPRENVTLEHD